MAHLHCHISQASKLMPLFSFNDKKCSQWITVRVLVFLLIKCFLFFLQNFWGQCWLYIQTWVLSHFLAYSVHLLSQNELLEIGVHGLSVEMYSAAYAVPPHTTLRDSFASGYEHLLFPQPEAHASADDDSAEAQGLALMYFEMEH